MNLARPIETPEPVKLTLADFELLAEAGAFEGMGKVELIEGVILRMSPQVRAHTFAVNELGHRLRVALGKLDTALHSLINSTVSMPPRSAPEPDIALTDEPQGEGYVPLGSVALAVEVSRTSARFDLGPKATLYAKHGVPEYWVVELGTKRLHQFWSPREEAYGESRIVPLGEPVESVTIAGLAVATDGLI